MNKRKDQKRALVVEPLKIQEPFEGYARNKEISTFFGQPMVRGSYAQIDPARMTPEVPTLFYAHPDGEIWIGDAIVWLRSLESESVDLIFADPPYNIKKAEWDSAETSRYGKGSQDKRRHWRPHPKGAKPKDVIEIPTTCNGMHEKTPHPTQKPEELLRKIVLASSNPDDLVVDPFLGSGTTAVVAEQLKRKWKGCDISLEYCQWAARSIELVEDWPIEKWIRYDLENAERRKSIR